MNWIKLLTLVAGVMGVLVILISLTTVIAKNNFSKMVAKEIDAVMLNLYSDASIENDYNATLQSEQANHKRSIITEQDVAHLPEPVRRWLGAVNVIGSYPIERVYSEQKAMVRLNRNNDNWNQLTAIQYNTLEQPAFLWQANFKMAPFIHMAGRDMYYQGKGNMQIRLQSAVKVVDASGHEIDQGSMVRYLAEIVWMPTMALEQYITWEAIDENKALAKMEYAGLTVSGIFTFDEQGYPIEFIADRYGEFDGEFANYPWQTTMTDYQELDGGIKVPLVAEITWKLPEGDYTWYKLELKHIKFERAIDRSMAVYSPFNLSISPMERLLLINIEKDPDDYYIGFEPQIFDDEINGTGMLVIAWRKDGYVDVYHQPSLNLYEQTYNITGKGLDEMIEVELADAYFEVRETGVATKFSFTDKYERPITVNIVEENQKQRKPFALLAPMGMAAENPQEMPLVFLHDFYFARQKDTQVEIKIAGKQHQADKMPVPIDGSKKFFMRYSPEPLITSFNKAVSGELRPLNILNNRMAEQDGTKYQLATNEQGNVVIEKMLVEHKQRAVQVEFNPALPNIADLGAKQEYEQYAGEFVISSDESLGTIAGEYQIVSRANGDVNIELIPSAGWRHNENKLAVRAIYTLVPDFKNWPKTYLWQATISQRAEGGYEINSSWARTN